MTRRTMRARTDGAGVVTKVRVLTFRRHEPPVQPPQSKGVEEMIQPSLMALLRGLNADQLRLMEIVGAAIVKGGL